MPLLPDHRQQDWRLLEVLRPLLFAITAELHGVPRLLEHLPASARIWHPDAVQVPLRAVLIDCLTQTRSSSTQDRQLAEQQCFDLQAFIALIDGIKHGRLNISSVRSAAWWILSAFPTLATAAAPSLNEGRHLLIRLQRHGVPSSDDLGLTPTGITKPAVDPICTSLPLWRGQECLSPLLWSDTRTVS